LIILTKDKNKKGKPRIVFKVNVLDLELITNYQICMGMSYEGCLHLVFTIFLHSSKFLQYFYTYQNILTYKCNFF